MSENECTCFPVPEKYWTTHYGAVDPATTHEPNPDCRVHFSQPTAAEQMAFDLYGPPPEGDEDPHASQAVPDPGETSGQPPFAFTEEHLDNLPVGIKVSDIDHDEWTKAVPDGWRTSPEGPLLRSKSLAALWGPFTVVSLPEEA